MERQRIVFDELIDHRLSQVRFSQSDLSPLFFSVQGFQMIVEIPNHIDLKMRESIRRANYQPTEHNRLLSIGRIYHTLSLVIEETQSQDSVAIYVQQYKPQFVNQRGVVAKSKGFFFLDTFHRPTRCLTNIAFNAQTRWTTIRPSIPSNWKISKHSRGI